MCVSGVCVKYGGMMRRKWESVPGGRSAPKGGGGMCQQFSAATSDDFVGVGIS